MAQLNVAQLDRQIEADGSYRVIHYRVSALILMTHVVSGESGDHIRFDLVADTSIDTLTAIASECVPDGKAFRCSFVDVAGEFLEALGRATDLIEALEFTGDASGVHLS